MGYLSQETARRVLTTLTELSTRGQAVAGGPFGKFYGKSGGYSWDGPKTSETSLNLNLHNHVSKIGGALMKVKDVMVKEVATLEVNDELSLANDIMRLGGSGTCRWWTAPGWWGLSRSGTCSSSSLAQALGYASKDTRDLMKTLRIKDVMVHRGDYHSSGYRVV